MSEALTSEPTGARPPLTPLRVVVVDDDAAHGDSLVALLSVEGYRVQAFSDPTRGLDYVIDARPEVLLLDLDMPGLSGIDLLARLKAKAIPTKTIVLTGTQDFGVVGDIVRLGAYDFLSKPAPPNRLLATVGRAVAMATLERESEANAAAAQRSNRLHEFLVQATPDLVYMLDASGKFTYLNNKLKDIFQIDADELIGKPWTTLFERSRAAGVGLGAADGAIDAVGLTELLKHRFDERRSASRSTQDFEFDLISFAGQRRGEVRTLQCTSTGLFSDAPVPMLSGTYGVIRDVTSRRRAERDRLELQTQIQQASKMEAMGQLAGGIAHDFNNILASMIGYAELVQSAHDRLKADAVESYLGEVVTAGHRARDLIAQMLTFTRTSRSEPQPVSVAEVIDNVSRMLRAAIPSSIRLKTGFDDDLPDALADKIQLQQILLNLVVNARDAIAGTGEIEISVQRQEPSDQSCHVCGAALVEPTLALTVRDSGHGIPAELQSRIFEMYFTTRDGSGDGDGMESASSGTGLGLWLINSLVHDHNGHIELESAEGVGTSFTVHLPIAATAAVVVAEPDSLVLDGQILVVDDEVSVGNFIGEILQGHGYDVVVYSDSQGALRYVQTNPDQIALLVTDQAMPVINGLDLIQAVRDLNPQIPAILITGYTGDTDRERLRALKVEGYLAKPFRITELLGSIVRHGRRPLARP